MADSAPAKIALVTGAGSGIGRAAALGLAGAGWTVVLAGRRPEALAETAREAGELATRLTVAPADVTDPAAVRELFELIRQKHGRLDLLFNNAGIGAPAMPLEELPVAKWREVIDTNVTGAFLCTQEAFRLMKAQRPRGGRIINNGSISAHVPRPHAAAYNAAKHAVTGLTKSAALDGRAFDIACGQIDIGNVETGLATRMKSGALQADGRMAPEPTFPVRNLVEAIVYMAGLPLEANVPFMTVMATGMPYIGRG
ncbi:MAG TPA: SDR family NAD(P)-dependent oxidoreductase [Lacunisphaera sp.]|nr:SDR family NAD(P)-dependent oxidoreductase [Lacunisphaera sp.]